MDRVLPMIMLLAALLVGCASASSSPASSAPASSAPAGGSGPASIQPQASSQPTSGLAASGLAASPSPGTDSPLEGIWKTTTVTPADMEAALRKAGLQKWIQPFLATGVGDSNVFTLRIKNGQWIQYWSKDGGPADNNDEGSYEITGDVVTITHPGGVDALSWSVDGGELTLGYVSNKFPPYNGIPEEVYQHAFYTAAVFERQP